MIFSVKKIQMALYINILVNVELVIMAEKLKRFAQYLAERYKGTHAMDAPPLSEPHADPYAKAYYAPGADKDIKRKIKDDANNATPLAHLASPGFDKADNVMPYGKKSEKPGFTDGKKKKKKTKGHMKTESFLAKTSEMSDAEFTHYMLNRTKQKTQQTVSDVYGEQFVPEPAQTMRYVANLMLANENMMSRMVRELKRNGGLASLLKELFQHPELYPLLKEAVENGSFGERPQQKLMQLAERAVMQPRWGAPSASTGGGMASNPAGGMGGAAGMPGANPAPTMPGQPGGMMGMPGQGEGGESMDPNAMGGGDMGMGGDPSMGGGTGAPPPMPGSEEDPDSKHHHHHHDEDDEDDDEDDDSDEDEDDDEDEDSDDDDEDDDEDEEDGHIDPHQKEKDMKSVQGMQANNMGPGMPGMGGM
jgi:hypothetical protein